MLTFCLNPGLPVNADKSCNNSISPSIAGNVERTEPYCSEKTTIKWNDANSTTNLARNSTRVLTIIEKDGVGGKYTWSVIGTGFSLEDIPDTHLSKRIKASSSACGSATITITGCNEKLATGYVRCATGRWVGVDTCVSGVWGKYCKCIYINGDTKVETAFMQNRCFGGDGSYTCPNGVKGGNCYSVGSNPDYCNLSNLKSCNAYTYKWKCN